MPSRKVDPAGGACSLDRAGDQAQFAVDEALMEVSRLALLFGQKLLEPARSP